MVVKEILEKVRNKNNEGVVAESWKTKLGFLLAAMGSAIGLGNIWRFPGLAYENGGGAFLIPYFIALFVVGIPLILGEFYLGYTTKKAAPNALASLSQRFRTPLKVLGYLIVINAFVIVSYYTVVIGWTVFYSVMSLFGRLSSDLFMPMVKSGAGLLTGDITSTTVLYVLSFTFVWALTYYILVRGVKGIERVCKIFIPLMWAILLLLLIRFVTLEGSMNGILQYLTPNFAALTNPSVWINAFGQVFFSLSLAFGIMIAYAKYLKKQTISGSYVVALGNSSFELLAGFVVFAVLGFMTSIAGVTLISELEVPYSGAGLSFVTFPLAIQQMPFSYVFGVLFFVLLFMAGLTSLLSLIEAFASSLKEDLNIDKKRIITVLTLIGFISGFVYIVNIQILDKVDAFINYSLVFLGLLEALAIGYLFTKLPKNLYMTVTLKVLAPLLLFIIFVVNTAQKLGYLKDLGGKAVPQLTELNLWAGLIFLIIVVEMIAFAYLLYRHSKD